MIHGNVTSFKRGDVGGNSRDFQMTDFQVTSVYPDGEIELAFDYKGLRYYLEIDFGKLMAAALQRAEVGGGVR